MVNFTVQQSEITANVGTEGANENFFFRDVFGEL